MATSKIKKGDQIIVLAGKDKGKQGDVIKVLDNGKLIVENINMVKKHVKPNPNKGENGGILDKEMPIEASNVAIYNAATGKGDRIGFKILEDNRKVRVFKSNGEVVDV